MILRESVFSPRLFPTISPSAKRKREREMFLHFLFLCLLVKISSWFWLLWWMHLLHPIAKWKRRLHRREQDELFYFFKYGPSQASFQFIFDFSSKHYNFYNKLCEKCPSSIRCWDSNPQPSEHEPTPLTTRSALLPKDELFVSTFPRIKCCDLIVNSLVEQIFLSLTYLDFQQRQIHGYE